MDPKNTSLTTVAVAMLGGLSAAVGELPNPLHRVIAIFVGGMAVFLCGVYVDRKKAQP